MHDIFKVFPVYVKFNWFEDLLNEWRNDQYGCSQFPFFKFLIIVINLFLGKVSTIDEQNWMSKYLVTQNLFTSEIKVYHVEENSANQNSRLWNYYFLYFCWPYLLSANRVWIEQWINIQNYKRRMIDRILHKNRRSSAGKVIISWLYSNHHFIWWLCKK